MMKKTAVILTLLVALPAAAQQARQPSKSSSPECVVRQGELPKIWEGQAFAIDGDTIGGIGLKPPIRLWGIQAPELRDVANVESTAGMRARAALEDMLARADHRVTCRVAHFDGACNLVAQCTVTAEMPTGTAPAPHDPALRLVEDGLAYGFHLEDALTWDREASARYAHFEGISRQARKGLWPQWLGEPEPVTPATK
jgi:endonuclease YncB( thermonuclease family)